MILKYSALILLLPVLSHASSSTLYPSISSRDYTQGLNVVKSNTQDQEYVTSFYKRVQYKVKDRDGLFTNEYDDFKQQQQQQLWPEEQEHQQEEITAVTTRRKPFSFLQKSLSQNAAGIRGGGANSLKLSPCLRYVKQNQDGPKKKKKNAFKSPSFRVRKEPVTKIEKEVDDKHYFTRYDNDVNEKSYGNDCYEEGQDDYSPGEHHLGLLRVPCSIAINSGEDGRFQHGVSDVNYARGRGGGFDDHYVKTPIAAYVDTGAQVTVISASAARRAGILHLMDRRYAGRATGVGHCKVLGRIPARHVYFFLGEDDQSHISCRGYEEDGEGTVRMDGPALTVLEGTVTKGVDMLLGLDVLQDWDAEIRMGRSKSITVKKKEGRNGRLNGGDSVVIPFVCQGDGQRQSHLSDGSVHDRVSSYQSKARQHSNVSNKSSHQHIHQNSIATQFHRRHYEKPTASSWDDNEKYFSPTASDIESDLDLLEKSKHDEEDLDSEIFPRDFDDEAMLTIQNDDEEEDYLQDVEEGDAEEGHFDMSGL